MHHNVYTMYVPHTYRIRILKDCWEKLYIPNKESYNTCNSAFGNEWICILFSDKGKAELVHQYLGRNCFFDTFTSVISSL